MFLFIVWIVALILAWLKLMKLTLEQLYMLSVLHSQYQAYLYTGDFMS